MNAVRLLAAAYSAGTVATIGIGLRSRSRLFRRDPGQHMRLLGLLRVPRLSPPACDVSGVLLISALLLAAIGWLMRWMLASAIILYVFYFGQILDRSGLLKKTNLVPLFLAVFLVSPGVDASWRAAPPTWPVIAAQSLLVCTYFSAGLAKLRNTGPRWAAGGQLRAYLIDNHLWRGAPFAWRIAQHRPLCALMSSYALIVELLMPLALLSDIAAAVLVLAAIAMHLGIQALMGINYLRYWWPNYLSFLVPLALAICQGSICR